MDLLLPALALSLVGSPAEPDKRLTALNRGTVKVLATKPGSRRPDPGAAIMIGDLDGKTFFLTACHVVDEDAVVEIQTFDKRMERVGVSAVRRQVRRAARPGGARSAQLRSGGRADRPDGPGSAPRGRPGARLRPSPDGEWHLRETKVTSATSTRIFVEPRVIDDGDSGGPLLDTTGGLVGVILGNAAKGPGQAVRLDTALAVLDVWRVPYKIRLQVDFCEQINRIIAWSENDFNEIKGAEIKTDYARYPEWQLRDKSMDITGEGRSKLARNPSMGSEKKTQYIANFGKQRNEKQAREVWRNLADRVQACLPGKERIFTEGDNCLYSAWRQRFTHTPIQFVTYLKPFDSEVELIMYREYTRPYACKR